MDGGRSGKEGEGMEEGKEWELELLCKMRKDIFLKLFKRKEIF